MIKLVLSDLDNTLIPHRPGEPFNAAKISDEGLSAIRAHDLLQREVPELDFALPSPDAMVIDILPKGYGKGSAARIMAESLGIGLDEIAVFGDADNDLSMLEDIPNSVAVANASARAAAAARWHIGDALEESVAKAMAEIAAATAQGGMPAFMRD